MTSSLAISLARRSVVLHSQCSRRDIACEYPKESKRGKYRWQQYLERVGKGVAEKTAEVDRLAADVELNGGSVAEAQGHIGGLVFSSRSAIEHPEHPTFHLRPVLRTTFHMTQARNR